MKAAQFQKAGEPLIITDLPDPEPAPDELIISVQRCGVCGTDLHLTEPGEGIKAQPGAILGHEMAGEVVGIGKDVTNFKIGDRVASLPLKGCGQCGACKSGDPFRCVSGPNMLEGGFAQYARVGAFESIPLSSQLSMEDGALTEPLSVALHGILMAPDIKGKTVTVIGAGPIGLSAIFWARRLGAKTVQIVASNPHRRKIAMGMGADTAFDNQYPDQDPAVNTPELAEVVIECVGKPNLIATAINLSLPKGTVISLGFCMSPDTILPFVAAMREVTLKFPICYTVGEYQQTIDALDSGAVDPRAMVSDTISLDDLPDTLEDMRCTNHRCKVMVNPWK